MRLGQRSRRIHNRLRKDPGNGVGDAGKLLVTLGVVLVAVQLLKEEGGRGLIARAVQKVNVSGLKAARLKTFDFSAGPRQ